MTRYLLDTHVVVWLLLDERARFSEAALSVLEDESLAIAYSAGSVWEIAIKRSRGRLGVPEGWSRALTRLDIDPMPVTALHAAAVEQLPWHHSDPFDRLLVAQARLERRALLSADKRLRSYDVEVVW